MNYTTTIRRSNSWFYSSRDQKSIMIIMKLIDLFKTIGNEGRFFLKL